jgi:microcystin-dependent protein
MGTPFMSEIKIISWNFAPRGWAFCNGQTLPINQNQALFSLLGTTYGGNGQTTFGLPNLQGRVPIHMGASPGGGTNHVLGEAAGQPAHTLTQSEMPAHTHTFNVDATTLGANNQNVGASNTVLGQSVGIPNQGSPFPVNMYSSGPPASQQWAGTIGNAGGSQAHYNTQPYLVLNFIIALQGVFPSQN